MRIYYESLFQKNKARVDKWGTASPINNKILVAADIGIDFQSKDLEISRIIRDVKK